MPDFPAQAVLPLFVHTMSRWGTNTDVRGHLAGTSAASFAWPSADLAAYCPVVIPWPFPVNRVFWYNGSTATSNVDFGIYTMGGSRIYSTGSTAQSGAGASVPQFVTPSTPFILYPGRYYFALTCSGTTNRITGISTVDTTTGRFAGMLQQASALPLPATATFAAWASSGMPLCGVTRTPSGF
jgi:hypothetical protein